MNLRFPLLLLTATTTTLCGCEKSSDQALAKVSHEGFIGRAACVECHQMEDEAFENNHHHLALGRAHADAQIVQGKFESASCPTTHDGATFRSDGKRLFVTSKGLDGQAHEYEILWTLGTYPLQQYLVAMPDGRIQCLPFAYDSRAAQNTDPIEHLHGFQNPGDPRIGADQGGQAWYHLHGKDGIAPHDPLFWQTPLQNFNHMCMDCHTTASQKGYDVETNTFHSTYTEGFVSCESCHGPGAAHAKWAQDGEDPSVTDKGMAIDLRWNPTEWKIGEDGIARKKTSEPQDAKLAACFRCHARRSAITGDVWTGEPLLDTHLPELIDNPQLYYADGQVRDEVFEWGSFTQSKMYQAGVVCWDCHDPHSLKLRLPPQQICARCHDPKSYNSFDHTQHQTESNVRCIDCHMAPRVYMGVDVRLDHSFRIPRPDISNAINAPHACQTCHQKEGDKWCADTLVQRWYTDKNKPLPETFAHTFHDAHQLKPEARLPLLRIIQDETQPAIVRASAVRLITPWLTSPRVLPVIGELTKSKQPLLRMTAARALGLNPRDYFAWLQPLLTDPVKAVRIEAAFALSELLPEQCETILESHIQGNLDQVGSMTYRAQRLVATQKIEEAITLATLATKQHPHDAATWLTLADIYRQTNDNSQRTATLQQGLTAAYDKAALQYALGLSLWHQKVPHQALPALRAAWKINPQQPDYALGLILALESLGQDTQGVMKEALKYHPHHKGLLATQIRLMTAANRPHDAKDAAKQMQAWDPDDSNTKQYVEQLLQQK